MSSSGRVLRVTMGTAYLNGASFVYSSRGPSEPKAEPDVEAAAAFISVSASLLCASHFLFLPPGASWLAVTSASS